MLLFMLECVCMCTCVVLPAAPHYPAALCSSSGGKQLWILLAASEVKLHPLLVTEEHYNHNHYGL